MASDNMTRAITGFPLLSEAGALMVADKFDQAAQLTMQHLRQHPNEPRGLAQLGSIAIRLGALGQAEHFFRLALKNGASAPEVKRNLASILNQQERLAEARAMFEALIADGDDSLTSILAVILDKLGRTGDAMEMRRRLVENEPENPFHWIAYGHSLRAAGKVDEAVSAYRTAAKADYECGEAWWGLASIKSRILTDDDIVEMRRAIAVAIDVRNSAPAHFALARALHDRGEYAEAFEHYAVGNRQRADSIGYNAEELTAEVSEVERSVTSDFVKRLEKPTASDDIPVFIVSLPRSGSTLLEQMLGNHGEIEPVGELPYVPAILRSVIELATRRGQVTVPQLIANMDDRQAEALGADYLRRAKLHRKTDKRFFVDKLPHNWSNILFIRRILPQAKFIDIRRPAMDCCFSNFTQSFSTAHASSFVLEDIGRCYVDYVRYMRHLDKIAPYMVHHVAYDRLIEDAEDELKSILAYLDLSWDAAMLDFHKSDRVVRTPSSEQVRRPLNRDGVDIWKPYSQWLDPLRNTLGVLADSS
jgi:tetratricopeptide (TPR) repeat protein